MNYNITLYECRNDWEIIAIDSLCVLNAIYDHSTILWTQANRFTMIKRMARLNMNLLYQWQDNSVSLFTWRTANTGWWRVASNDLFARKLHYYYCFIHYVHLQVKTFILHFIIIIIFPFHSGFSTLSGCVRRLWVIALVASIGWKKRAHYSHLIWILDFIHIE